MRRLTTAVALTVAVLAAAAAARGELTQQGNLRVSFNGRLLPHALPRAHPAPVTVRLNGQVGTVDGSRPPQLRQISIAVNRAGLVSVAGLPTCTSSELQQTSTEAALELCRRALVGHGHFAVNVDFPNSPQIPAQGAVLVFNSRVDGRPALLLHLYGTSPVRVTFVLPFKISHRSHGRFGTVFSTKIPRIASDLGYVTNLDLTIGRKYRYAGMRRSFLSASCAAPAGFPGAVFEFAKGTFSFVDGQHLTTSLNRDCKVR
jgi:hypothetical protein